MKFNLAQCRSAILLHLTPLLAALAIFLGASVLLGWVLNFLWITRLSEAFIPMSPTTALCFILFGVVLLCRQRPPEDKVARRVWPTLAIFLLVLNFAVFIQSTFFNLPDLLLNFMRRVTPDAWVGQNYTVGIMSPVTAALFAILSFAALLSPPRPIVVRLRDQIAQCAAAFVFIIAHLIVIGYWYGAPLLYGGAVVPIALNTAIGFAFLSGGFLFESANAWLFHWLTSDSVSSRFTRLIIPGVILISLVGDWVHIIIFSQLPAESQTLSASLVAIFMATLISLLTVVVAQRTQATVTRAEYELSASEKRFKALIENAAEVIVIIDANGIIRFVSPSAKHILDFAPEESIGKNFLEWVHPDDLPQVIRSLESRRQTPGTAAMSLIARARHKNGSWRFIEAVGTNLLDEPTVQGIVLNMRDVTERKWAKEQLRQSEERYRMVADFTYDWEYWIDEANSKLIYISPSCERISGYSPTEFEEDPSLLPRIIHPADRPQFQAHTDDENSTSVDFRIVRRDGETRWIHHTCQEVYDSNGVSLGRRASNRDITVRKQAEESLRLSEMRYSALFKQAHDAIFITDLNGKLLAANQRAADMLGYAFDEVQHLSLSEISAETEKTKEVTRRLLAGEKIPLYERLFCKKDGTIFPVEINVDLVMDENGNPMHIQSVVRDITRRKQTEEALRQSEESYHGLFNSVTEAIYIQDEQGRFLDVNQGAVKMYGYPRDYFIGRTPEDLAAPDRNDMAVTAEKVRRAFAGEMQQFEFWGRRSNGEIFPKEVSVNRGLYFGKPVVIAAARDITERKRAEEKLRESEARNRAILNTIPDLMFLQDRVDGRFLDYHAPDLNSLLGPPEQFLGHAMAEVLPPELTDRFIAAADNAVSSRQTQTFEFSAPASDSMRTFESRITMMDEQRVITIVRDITERKQAEDKLRFQESRFRSLIENSHDGIALVDLSGVASFISPTLPRILGHQEKDLLNIFRADFVHPEDLPQIEMAAGHWLQEGAPGPLLLVYRYLHTDGSWCWLETVATNLLADPAVGAIVLNFHDITQRKLAEDVLRETKDQLAAILATLADGVSVTDSSGKLIYVNAAIARSAGYSSPQEMLESYHTQISTLDYGMVDETGKPFPLDQLPSRLVAQGKSAQPTVIGYRTPDHQPIRWVIMKAGPILDDQGKVKLVVTVTSDITERKRAEETLRRNRDLLLTLNHAAQAVQRARTPDQVYRAVGEELKALGYDLMIFTLTDDCRHLQIAYNTFAADLLRAAEKLSGLSAHSYQVPISPQSPFGRVVAGGRAEFANWTSDKAAAVLPKATRPLVGQMLKMMKIERGIVAPLRAEGTTMGVLTISGLEVEESDVPAVEAFTAHVAISLRNARLTQQVQQELEERKLAQEVLGEQRHFIEHVTEAVPDIIYVDDLIEHVSVFLSPSIFSILGYAVEDIRSGMINWHGLIHPDDLAAVQDSTERLLQMGDNEFVSVEYRMKHVDRSWRWLYARNVVFKRAADGRVQQVLGVAQDITERRQVEEKLRQNEEKYRGIFDESIAAVYIFDDKKNFINTNQAGLDLLGYSREELLRMGIPDVDANPAVVLPAHEQLLSGGRLVNYEHKLRRKDGTIITVLNNSSPLTDSRRNIVGMLSTLLDITERKQAEEKTQRRAEQFAILNDIGSRVTVSTSVNEVLQRVAQLVQEHFHYHHVGLFLYNAERAELVLRAQAGNFKILFPLDHHVRSDQGMVGWVCRERRTLLANDVRLEPAYVNVLGNLLAMRSELSVPIQSGESFFGVIDLQSAELNAFEDNDVLLIETLAQQIVVALENARLHEWAFRELAERERHEREMDTVIRMSATLRNVGSRAELSAAVVQLLREVLGVEHVLFGVADLLTGERVVIGASGNWTLLQGQRFATSFARQIAPDGTPHLVKDEDRAKFAHPELLEGLAGVVVTQLLINEEQLGSLWIGSARPISEETLQLFTLLAGLVANVMQRVNSVEQTERHTRRLTALHEIDLAISYSLDLEQTLNILLNQVCNQLRVDAADVLLYNREAQVLSYAAGFGFHTAALQHSLLRIGESLAGRAALEKKIVSSVDLSQTNNFSISPLFRQENFLSYYGVPLATRGEVVGVLEIFHRSLLQPNPDWLQFLEALAAQAAIAVDNASLFTQLQSSIKSLYETQEQLIRTARLSAVGELAAGIAHQINNPLTTVISDSQVLMRLTSDDDPLHVSAKAIYQAGWRAQRVVQRLLNFARPDENQYAPSNVNETIMESLDLIGAHLGRGGVDLQLHLASDLPLISANAHQLEEIWLNLLMNARDALSEERKGRIEVTSCLSANGEALEVSISDNGRGIRESDRANIFTPFFTTKGNNRGNGLGLSVCQSIAQHHGGEITFSSAEDVGTTFVVRMPLLRASS